MGPPARCVWCSLVQKRRYRLLDKRLYDHLGNAFVKLSQSETTARTLGITPHLELIAARRSYLKQVLEKIDVVISPSRFLIQKVREYGFQPRRLLYVPLGLDKTHTAHAESDRSSTTLRIGYLGQFAPHKGVHLLLAAFQRLDRHSDSCDLTLHGTISDASPYEHQLLKIGRRDPAITFAGPYPNSKVGQVLSDLDVIVVPSLWHEIGPTVIMEAYATQTPVVAARLGEMASLVRHNENGLLFEPGSAASLTRQLQRLLDEPALLPRLRDGIPPVPSIEEEIATLISLYRSLLPP